MSTSFTETNKKYIRPFLQALQLNDQLRDLTKREKGINVPTIVAVGDQSHGKTSVIEALCGVELPRGEGIQTRRPLKLKLCKLKTDCGRESEYATIKEPASEQAKEISIESIADEVRAYTEKLAEGVDVVDAEIELTVYRTDADDLTLIDLPGMTRVPVKNQSKNIEEVITKMYQRYMEPPENILLNVVSSMVDFATSTSMKMSRILDPKGKRTILCISKVDQHKESGLLNKIESTAYGDLDLDPANVLCVRNRSQVENDQGVTLASARVFETNFFRENEAMRELPEGSRGTRALSERLVAIQYEHIMAILPEVKQKITDRIIELDGIAEGFRKVSPKNENGATRAFDEILLSVMEELKFQYSGIGYNKKKNIALLCSKLLGEENKFTAALAKDYPQSRFFSEKMFDEIKAEAIERAGSEGMPGTISEQVPLQILRTLSGKMKTPIDDYVRVASNLITRQVLDGMKLRFDMVPLMCRLLVSVVEEVSAEILCHAHSRVDELLSYETQIKTFNPIYAEIKQSMRRELYNAVEDTSHEDERNSRAGSPDSATMNTSQKAGGDCTAGPPNFMLDAEFLERVRNMSTDDRKFADLQIDLFAYYEVLRRRLVDNVVICTRYLLGYEPIMRNSLRDKIRVAIESHCETNKTTYLKLMGRSEADQRKLIGYESRIEKLREAQRKLTTFEGGFMSTDIPSESSAPTVAVDYYMDNHIESSAPIVSNHEYYTLNDYRPQIII